MNSPKRSSSPFVKHEEPEFNISPLIDVAFLLLIYFIVTTTLQPQEADLSMTLPGVSKIESESVQIDQMQIEVDATGAILVNRDVVDSDMNNRNVPNLTDQLTRYALSARIAQSDPMVIIKCDGRVPEQRFIDVLNACARSGIKHVSISP